MILLGKALLAEVPGAKFVGEVKCSQAMYDELAARGGQVEMWKVGHSLIKARMKETGAQLAGEMSGHLFFAHRWLGFDDAIYAGARLLELLSRGERTLRRPRGRAAGDDQHARDPHRLSRRAQGAVVARGDRAPARGPAVKSVVDVDGVRASSTDGWGLVRASNTQPALVMRCEADSEEHLAEIRGLIERAIAEAK